MKLGFAAAIALNALVFVACQKEPATSRGEPPADAASPPADAVASDASAAPDVHAAVTAFAAAHGGLHGRTFQVPTVTEERVCERRDGGRGRDCRKVVSAPVTKTLFFVGGDVAQGGWHASTPPDAPRWCSSRSRSLAPCG
jgi:hypothetical protein